MLEPLPYEERRPAQGQFVTLRGLRYHLEDRVIVHGNKTILFA